jgi:hypothetical protein
MGARRNEFGPLESDPTSAIGNRPKANRPVSQLMIMSDYRREPRKPDRSAVLLPRCPNRSGKSSIALAVALALSACGGGGGGPTGGTTPATQAELLRVEFGRLVDVYGLQVTAGEAIPVLFQRDVVIGGNIQDQRPTNSSLRDDEVTYDFTTADPDTLQPALFIPRDVTGSDFRTAFDALDDQLREVTPMLFGEGGPGFPYSVVPRNGGIRLTFSGSLGVDDGFFVERDAQGMVTGLRNTEAVQLLKIVGDPTQPNGFVPMATRVVVRDNVLVLDPVLLGSEGLQYQAQNNAAGLPESPDSNGANIRVALALEGPLAIPRLRAGQSDLTGLNNSGRRSVVRDFRSGNANDTSADLSRGFVRDPLPLRVVGEIGMYLERVDDVNEFTQEITVFKNGISHEIDRSDVMRFVDASGVVGSGAVVVDPTDDLNAPATQHVRVRIRRVTGLEAIDPSNRPEYPAQLAAREVWLVANAPRAICLAEFTAGDAGGRDDPRNFLAFSPTPLPLNGVQPAPNEFVSPFAGAVVRFTKPVDTSTVRWADTFFFAMRDLTSSAGIEEFIANRPTLSPTGVAGTGMSPAAFNLAKFRTPNLIEARVFDEDGSQTSLRLQPSSGFYLDDTMRNPPAGADYRYFLHLISDSPDGGIKDLAGNPLDLQGTTPDRSNFVVIPFTVDTRTNANTPLFPDNLAISIVRRFASRDEDAMPSYFLPNEVQAATGGPIGAAYPLEDLFGGFVYVDNKLQARPTTRSRVVADNLNQTPVVQQTAPPNLPNPLGWCPQTVSGEGQIASNSSTNLVNAGIQNPLNPYGARMQTVWREIDLSLSRTDPFDFNLDIEQMYWAPFTGTNLSFDEFDSTSLYLGHSEYRPAPCVGDFSSLPSLPSSGLRTLFERNYAWNPAPTGTGTVTESMSPRRAAYAGKTLTIDPSSVVLEPNQVNRFLPLPEFQRPYFVYRDETVVEQGGNSGSPSDTTSGTYSPYILSPFANGQGRRWVDRTNLNPSEVLFVNGFWNDATNQGMPSGTDNFTQGLVGSIALPLLADFQTNCDSSELPAGGGYIALGTNGWQVSVTVQSDPNPNFRIVHAGRPPVGSSPAVCRQPAEASTAQGGFIGGSTATTPPGDNTFYWIMMDVVKRQSVITNGFIDLNNPHRVPEGFADPRLGPFYLSGGNPTVPIDVLPTFAYQFDPPLSQLPPGTSLAAQFRGASRVDPTPWYWQAWMNTSSPIYPATIFTAPLKEQIRPTAANFPLDPYKAGDAHIRKWDARPIPGGASARNWWTYFYNRTVTRYVEDPNELMNPAFTVQYQGPNEAFTPRDIRYVNWRFVTSNNIDANPPVAPTIETFALSYRFRRL